MRYTYFPGCSLRATSKAYDESAQEVSKILGLELEELDDWNCCGATSYMSVKEILSFCISGRNLALAEPLDRDLVTPCSACYCVLKKTDKYLKEFPELRKKVDAALAAGGLSYGGGVRVRHLLDVFVNDASIERIEALTKRPLEGLKVSPYYGCQIVRPGNDFDNPDDPTILERLLGTLGAEPLPMSMKVHCCGGSLMGTSFEVALRLTKNVLLCAASAGAEVVVTTCPLCQINLDSYQDKVNEHYGLGFRLPVLYFPQVMGLAFGMEAKRLAFNKLMVSPEHIARRYS